MSLLDMISTPMGQAALQQVGARVGLSPDMVRMAAGALAPAIAGGLARTGAPAGAAPRPGTDEAHAHGNDVLGRILGSKDASRSVANDAAQQTGLDPAILKKLLPQLASLAAGASGGGAGQGGLGGLGGMLGGLTR